MHVVGRKEDRAPSSKVKTLNSKPFYDARIAIELENFLRDLKTYFQATYIPKVEKVSITYLTGVQNSGRCTCLSDNASPNRDKIETWDVLKKDLKDQFLPCNM
ncbi:UNVERIFIED_CONTAM: hypothetical protein Sindi_2869300 [Sesamum indicum]